MTRRPAVQWRRGRRGRRRSRSTRGANILMVANVVTKARIRRMGGRAARAFDCNRRQAEGRKQRRGDDLAEQAHGGDFRKGGALARVGSELL
jgi:hypothetical protein